ncbi:MAG: DAK2 domain-containing protein [Eubacteriales bacterium]|nr:DAK2 domain-containing protein [bacterium]MDY2793158.1 DAK2 domain-containing protein [Eubacteriales bacterium]
MPITTIDGMMLRDMFMSGAALLEKNRQNIDALNVFPVPDGDTGTNMCHTISSAMKELATRTCPTAGEAASAVARGALKGARGNSGVILSQIFRGMSRALEGADEVDAALFAQAIRCGADTAYKAVMRPKEGTILTVARVVAEEVEREARRTSDLQTLMNVVIESGDAILKKTPEMLPVLKQAGVVDSGGKGLMVFFAGFRAALFGEPVEDVSLENLQPMPGEFVDDHDSLEEITFAYCTEFIVSHPRPDMKESDVARLRRRLEKIGDCVLVIGDLEVVKVHVHTNEPGKALQMALELGELDSIKIDNMLEEFRERQKKREADAAKEDKPFAIVAVALGDGLASLFKDLGVDKVVDGGQTMNPSIEDLVEAIDSTHAKEVFVLPNNSNIILAAQQAAELTERKVYVLPTKSVPMGLSAAIAFSESATGEENEAAMREAAEMVHTASITYAVRDTVFDGMDIHQGDIMGMIDNKINCLGHDVAEVARELMDKMVTEDSELISIYYGADTAEADAQALFEEAQEKYPNCDVEVHMGGQPLYYYLIAVQ